MRERTQAEIEAALTAYHGADGWDHNDRADMRAALAAADEVAPPAPVVINHSQVMTAHLFTDQEARMHAATFCLAPLRDLAGKREYDEALRRIVEMLTPSQQVESTPKAAP